MVSNYLDRFVPGAEQSTPRSALINIFNLPRVCALSSRPMSSSPRSKFPVFQILLGFRTVKLQQLTRTRQRKSTEEDILLEFLRSTKHLMLRRALAWNKKQSINPKQRGVNWSKWRVIIGQSKLINN